MVSISYAITVHNEGSMYLEPLFQKLIKHLKEEDEIVLLDDFSDDQSTVDTIEKYHDHIKLFQRKLDGDFSEHKNYLKSQCTKEYIFQIDGDELIGDVFLTVLKEVLYNNPQTDLFFVPRINLVRGITPEDISKWGWRVNENGWINSPDFQQRIFKNMSEIKWINKVHEVITGHISHGHLPYEDEVYSILHVKDIHRQRKQNEFYETL